MRTLARRIGLFRAAACLVGCALVLEIIRVQVATGRAVTTACSLGEVFFLVLAAAAFAAGRTASRPE